MTEQFKFNAIGVVRSCFKEKFGIPRQPGLIESVESTIEIMPPYSQLDAFRGIEQFSHIWVIFVFHQNIDKQWRTTVRPPRLGGNARIGVFASRSPFRPNPVGLSVVELLEARPEGDRFILRVQGADLLDDTPVLDIKPYIPYADAVDASHGYAQRPDQKLNTEFTEQAARQVEASEQRLGQPVHALIEQMLSLDPRPAYRDDDSGDGIYGIRLFDFNLRFRVRGNVATVLELEGNIN